MTDPKAESKNMDQMKLDALLAEYQQLYEHNRHDNNIGAAIQGVLATAAFIILGAMYQTDQQGTLVLLLASSTSILFYIGYLLYFEHLRIVIYTRFERIAEIEDILSKGLNDLNMDFIRTFDQRIERQKANELLGKDSSVTTIVKASFFLSSKLSQRVFRFAFLILLVLLWIVRLFSN